MKNMGDGRRIARVEREVQAVIATYLIRGLRVPLKGIVTVSQVKMPADLRMAKVYVSVLGEKKDQDEIIKTLQSRAFEIQEFVGNELKMRFCPKLTFYADETTDQVLKIDRILAEINQKKTSSSSEEDSE